MLDTSKIHNLLKAFSSIVLFVLCFTGHVGGQQMWINEFHYDNAGADVGEFIEVVVENGTDLTQVTVIRYDGNGSAESPVLNVDMDFTQGDTENGYTVYSVAVGLENDTEGIALTYQGVVVEFISFEGSFMAVDGLAAGYQSTDVGVSEDGATSIGFSLQRTGTGTSGSDFTWTGPVADSPGSLNTSQDLSDPSLTNTLTDTPQAPASEPVTRGDTIKYTIEISNTGNGDANGASIDRKIPLDPNTTLVPGSFKSTPLAYDAVVLNVQEDVAKTITLTGFDLDGDLLTYGITAPPANGSLGAIMPAGPTAGSATVQYTPNMDYFGPDQFEFTVTDDDNNACPAIVKVMVQPVNDPPSITCGPNQTVVNTAGAQSVMGWATGISVGPANESFQLPPTITVANDNNGLFSTQPAVATNGTLTYTPMAGASGLTNVTVTISDGVFADDVSCSFTITVQASPDAKDDALTTIEDTNLAEDLFADNGSGADNLGFPAATIASFGGGTLGGTVTSNAAGSSVALAGGTLTVNANGSITLTGQPFTLGTYTFMYRLTNVAGSDDATVTIEVEPLDVAPTVVSHTPANNSVDVAINSDITINFSEPVNVNDPASFTIVGSSSGSHAYTLSGGPTNFTLDPAVDFDHFEDITLTVVANQVTDQDLIDPPNEMEMNFVCTFKTIGLAPVCTNDGPAANSAPGDDFHTALNTTLNAADGSSQDLLTNDNLGAPPALITEFGPTAAVGTAAGSPSASANGGIVTVNANGSFSYAPPNNFTGLDTFFYELENSYGTVVCLATVAVGVRLACGATDSYTATGNIQISILAGAGVLANDMGDQLMLAINSTTANGTLTLSGDGSFTYDPDPGYTGTDVFTYDITNGFGTETCNGEVTVSQMIWFVDNSAAGSDVGTFNNPFQSIAAFNAAAGPGTGDFIALNTGSYTESDGMNLKNSQKVIGKGVQLDNFFTADANSIAGYQTYAGSPGTRPTIGTTGGGAGDNGIDLAQNNTLRGFNIANRTGAFAIKDNGANAGTVTVSNMIILGLGGGIEIDNGGTLDIDLDQLSATANAGANIGLSGIDLVGVSGSFVVDDGNLTHNTAPAIIIDGNPSLTLNLTFTSVSSDGGANGIDIDDATGSFTISGTGTTDGSGGTIQNHFDDGINITNATNLTFSNLNVTNNGNAVNDHGIELTEVTGTVDFNNVDVSFSAEKNVEIENTSGSMTFTADNCQFRDTQSSGTGADGLEINLMGTALATIDTDNNEYKRNRTNGLQVLAQGSSVISQCDITNSSFDSELGIGIGMDLSTNNSGSLTYNVIGNSRIRSRGGSAINSTAFLTSTIRGRIQNNPDIEVLSDAGSGIRILSEDNSDVVILIDNNTVKSGDFDNAISTIGRGGSTSMHSTISNNGCTVKTGALYGVEVRAQNDRTNCSNVTNNNVTVVGTAVAAFRVRESNAGSSVLLQGFTTDAATTWTSNGNTGAPVSESGAASGGTCTTVTHPLP